MTAGERIAALFEAYPTLEREQVQRAISRRIDAAIRKAAWEGYWVGRRAGQSGDSTDSRIEEMDLGRKYGHARRK